MSDYDEIGTPTCPADVEKDPDATIKLTFHWAAQLAGETISTSDFVLPDGLTEGTNSGTGSIRATLVSGGSLDTKYRVTNRITTSGGRTLDQTKVVLVREL
jgi:hypothetical protein